MKNLGVLFEQLARDEDLDIGEDAFRKFLGQLGYDVEDHCPECGRTSRPDACCSKRPVSSSVLLSASEVADLWERKCKEVQDQHVPFSSKRLFEALQ